MKKFIISLMSVVLFISAAFAQKNNAEKAIRDIADTLVKKLQWDLPRPFRAGYQKYKLRGFSRNARANFRCPIRITTKMWICFFCPKPKAILPLT
jgi:hypothetical protein